MTGHSEVRDFLIGIDYDALDEDKGHMNIRRNVTMVELVE